MLEMSLSHGNEERSANHNNEKEQDVTNFWDGGTWNRPYGLELVSQKQCEESSSCKTCNGVEGGIKYP